jgi:hypothetical protein
MCAHNLSKYLFFIIAISVLGCNKFIDIDAPKNQVASDNVFQENTTAAGVLTGMYALMSSDGIFTGRGSISLKGALSADELTLYGSAGDAALSEIYVNAMNSRSSGNPWSQFFKYINVANTAIEGLNGSKTLTDGVKQQLIGESLFIRAFLHFYLVNLYDSVPLVTSSDYRVNNVITRSAPDLVYKQIVDDLNEAISKLSENYLAADVQAGSSERVRPTKWAAEALLARVYLYKKDYANAVVQATNVISRSDMFDTTSLSDVFLATSKEAIWQLAPTSQDVNTLDGNLFILKRAPSYSKPVYCSTNLLDAFEEGDLRRTNWVNSVLAANGTRYYFPFKYKIGSGGPPTEYTTILRLGEQYLIRAEANANLGGFSAANDDLNVIRARAGLPAVSYSNKEDLLAAILHERQVELFTEWGHRWLDLKRTGTVDAVMSVVCTQKGGTWKSTASYFPIPLSDLLRNKNLTQNSGY